MATASALGAGLCEAVDAALPGSGDGAGPGTTGGEVDRLARAVVGAMWRASPQQVALLLDDLHQLPPDSEAARLLDAVGASLPGNGHLVLAGRAAPPVALARLDVEGRVAHLGQADLTFTEGEIAEFAALRGVEGGKVSACGGWPALAELYAGARSSTPGDYVGQEVLAQVPADRRRGLALLAHVGPFDGDVAAAILGPGTDVHGLVDGLPLVTRTAGGEWHVHSLWQSLLTQEVTEAEIAEARSRAGREMRRRDRFQAAVRLLAEAGAWDEVAGAIVDALGVAHPPVARDVLAGWLARLPGELRTAPAGLLLAAVASTEGDPDGARQRLEDAVTGFRAQGWTGGELACLVQLGQMAWWSEDPEGLAAVAKQAFDLEATGYEPVRPIACLGRALLFDIDNDSRRMLAELDRIVPGSLNDAWSGIVSWARAIGLLELGHTAEALEAADRALARGHVLHAPLAQTTRLQALWYQGRTAEVLEDLPAALESIRGSGYRNHTALIASQCCVADALAGRTDRAAAHLDRAEAAAATVADAPLVDTNLTVARAALAAASGDEPSAAALLAGVVDRRPVREGMSAAPQQRHLALLYVLVPATRPVWEEAELGPAWAFGRELARAVIAVREGRSLPAGTPPLDRADLVGAHLPPRWIAELGVAAVAARRDDGWELLDRTWPASRPATAELACDAPRSRLRKAAREVLGRLAAPPTSLLELRVLGPVELHRDGEPVQAPEWRRERVRSLLAYLVLHGTVSRETLAGDLWPDLSPEARSRNLRVTLTYLLRVLEPDRSARDASFFVRQHGSNVALHPGDWLTVDLWDFDAHCDRAARADREGDPGTALRPAQRAADLWRGEPTEVASEPWAVAPLEQRQLRFPATATRAGELLLARGDADSPQRLAERALSIDPWHEAAHRLLVATHRARGDDVAARRALHRYREAVHDLGVGPDEATLMVERLLDRLPAAASPG